MSDYLERLERQLVAAVEEGAPTAPVRRLTRGGGVPRRESDVVPRPGGGAVPRRGGVRGAVPRRGAMRGASRTRRSTRRAVPVGLLAAALALLVGAAVTFAITGVLAPGSAVRPATKPVPGAGVGVPLPGRSRLLAQAPDPEGGPPWGLRLVRTTRGLQCIQLGRVENGQLGVLGIDGAFRDDGRFHALPSDVLGRAHGGVQAFVTCLTPGQRISMEAGLPRAGSWTVGGRHARDGGVSDPATSRWISFGLLGPRAVSVSYPADRRVDTQAVARGTGAYLIALANPKRDILGGAGGASGEGLLNPQGAVSLIAYRLRGGLCSAPNPMRHGPRGGHPLARCPRPARHSHRPTVHRLHHAIAVRRLANGDLIVTFTAPYPVRSAVDQYAVQISYRCHRGTVGIPLERDVRAGEIVHMRVQRPFASACGASLTVEVDYQREGGRYGFDPRSVTVVGQARVARRHR